MKKVFPYLYGLLILSQFMIGQLYLPGLPLNILQIITLLMLAFCIMMDRKIPNDKYIILYSLFLLFYLISALFTGYTDTLLGGVIPQVMVSFTVFWATKILIQRYDTLSPLVIPVVIAGVVDSIVTIFQAMGQPILSPYIVMLMQNTEALDVANDGMLGASISGLFMNPVFNGHALLFCFVTSLFALQGKHKLITFTSSIVILVGLFFCQQRSAFYLSIIVLIIVGWKYLQKNLKTKLLVIISLLFAIFYLLPWIESYAIDSGSRIVDTDLTGRDEIWTAASDFFSENWFWGGFDKFVQEYGRYPHNLVFSAYFAGGLIGGTILMVLIVMLLINSLKSLRYSDKNNITLLVSLCLIVVLIADSFTHNTGLVEADFSTILAMSLCYYYNVQNPKKILKTF